MNIPLPHPGLLRLLPGQSDAKDAKGRKGHSGRTWRPQQTAAGAPILYAAFPGFPPGPIHFWHIMVWPAGTYCQKWRFWVVGNPSSIFEFCRRRGWPYHAQVCERIDPELPAVESD